MSDHTAKMKNILEMLAGILDERNLSEIEVEDKDLRLRIAREKQVVNPSVFAPVSQLPSEQASLSPSHSSDRSPQQAPNNPANIVTSPIVGTAYLSPEPGAAAFVSVGDHVKAGQTLLIVEAMKVMNPITAPRSGIVQNVFVLDSEPVEFGAPLVELE